MAGGHRVISIGTEKLGERDRIGQVQTALGDRQLDVCADDGGFSEPIFGREGDWVFAAGTGWMAGVAAAAASRMELSIALKIWSVGSRS
jgi:hypothetical protein